MFHIEHEYNCRAHERDVKHIHVGTFKTGCSDLHRTRPSLLPRQDFIRDYIEEFTVLTLVSIGWGPFNYPMWSGTLLLPNDEPNTSSIGGGGGAGGTII